MIVGSDGQISLPLAGRIQASGLTIAQLEQRITERLSEYIKYPRVSVMKKRISGKVSVMIKQFSGDKIIILGEVNYPGIYTYSGAINLIEAIALAGDFTGRAKQNSIMIVRRNSAQQSEVNRVNLSRVILKGISTTDIILRPNDVIYVPKTFIANFNHPTVVNTIVNVVSVLTQIVSMKVPVIAKRPFFAGSSLFEAACAIAADPKPDSFDNTPRLTPKLMAFCTLVPINAPATARTPKADLKIRANAAGIWVNFTTKIIIAPAK